MRNRRFNRIWIKLRLDIWWNRFIHSVCWTPFIATVWINYLWSSTFDVVPGVVCIILRLNSGKRKNICATDFYVEKFELNQQKVLILGISIFWSDSLRLRNSGPNSQVRFWNFLRIFENAWVAVIFMIFKILNIEIIDFMFQNFVSS